MGAVHGWWASAGVRVRSTVAATALLAVVVAAGTLVAWLLLRQELYSAVEASGAVQARLVRLSVSADVLTHPPGSPDADAEARADIDTAVGADGDRGSHIQVVDARGEVVARSAALAGSAPLSREEPAVAQVVQRRERIPALAASGGQDWMVTVVGAAVDGRRFTVVVAESTAAADASLRRAGALAGAGVPALLLVVAVATWMFVGRSLRPVEAIRATVEGITDSGLDGRVPVPAGQDEISRLAVTMNSMLGRLQESQRTQRAFVADASHELRSPVATLRAAAEVWRAHPGSSTAQEFVDLVGAESARVEQLVADLLLLARADEHRLASRRADVDLDALVEAEVARLRSATTLTVGVSTSPLRVLADERQIARVLRNLVDNAARHAASRVDLALRREGAWAVLAVADDGPGIAPADATRVFGRFVRLQASRDRASGGAGLGLAIVAELVTAHGGSVRVVPGPGPGAVLEVRLPLAAQPPSAASR